MKDPEEQTPAIAVRGVRHTYQRRGDQVHLNALDNITFEVPQGQFVCILGPNGSGKSTLLSALCGLIQPHEGSIEIYGSTSAKKIRQSIGVVFQRASLDGDASVFENLRDQAVLYGVDSQMNRVLINKQLEQAGLLDTVSQFVQVLSAGQQRRIDLIRANLHQPRLLLLDEPTVGLDPNARLAYLQQLDSQRHNDQKTILMSTHLIDEANAADRIILMHKGQIIADAPPAQLRHAVGQRLITVNELKWRGDQWEGPGHFSATATGWQMPLNESDVQKITAVLAAQGVSFSVAPPTLGDAFQQLTGQSLNEPSKTRPTRNDSEHKEVVS